MSESTSSVTTTLQVTQVLSFGRKQCVQMMVNFYLRAIVVRMSLSIPACPTIILLVTVHVERGRPFFQVVPLLATMPPRRMLRYDMAPRCDESREFKCVITVMRYEIVAFDASRQSRRRAAEGRGSNYNVPTACRTFDNRSVT